MALFTAVKGSTKLIEFLKTTKGMGTLVPGITKKYHIPKEFDDEKLLNYIKYDNYGFDKNEMAKKIGVKVSNLAETRHALNLNRNKINKLIRDREINLNNKTFTDTFKPLTGSPAEVRSQKLFRKKQYLVDQKAEKFNIDKPSTWEGLVETHGDTVKSKSLKFVIPSLQKIL